MSRFSRFQSFHKAQIDNAATAPRRVGHGGTAYTSAAGTLRQPQDGAYRAPSTTVQKLPTVIAEPEDAFLTGVTRSLGRRLLGLNIGSALRKTSNPLPSVKRTPRPVIAPAA